MTALRTIDSSASCRPWRSRREPRARASRWLALAAGLWLGALAAPARADHATIVVDGHLDDLIGAIDANLGSDRGGFAASDPQSDPATGACDFTNGFDLRNTYLFVDFQHADGTPADPSLYVGWEAFGLIGDVDGDGDPSTFSDSNGGCAELDQTGIGSLEWYRVELDVDCDGSADLRIAVTRNSVWEEVPDVRELTGAQFASDGHFLELRVDHLADLLPAGIDFTQALIHTSANAPHGGMGIDLGATFTLELPSSCSVACDPDRQSAVAGDLVTWTIPVTNEGWCPLDEVTVEAHLDPGLRFESSVPASVGGSDCRRWDLAALAPGESVAITLQVRLESCEASEPQNHVTVTAVEQRPASCDLRLGTEASIDATVAACATASSALVPASVALLQNHPNPFARATTIDFSVPNRSTIRLSVFDIAGHELATLVEGEVGAGRQSVVWNPQASGRPLAPGAYLARLQATSLAGGAAQDITQKLVLIE